MAGIPGFGIDRVATAVGNDPEVLRLENLDTDLPPPQQAQRATREAVGQAEANSWLPFTGKADLRQAVADQLQARSGVAVDPATQVSSPAGRATPWWTRCSPPPIPVMRSS
jgi:aspartate/methionine/tyrosine aminotransferase